jgi:hypothetical protein
MSAILNNTKLPVVKYKNDHYELRWADTKYRISVVQVDQSDNETPLDLSQIDPESATTKRITKLMQGLFQAHYLQADSQSQHPNALTPVMMNDKGLHYEMNLRNHHQFTIFPHSEQLANSLVSEADTPASLTVHTIWNRFTALVSHSAKKQAAPSSPVSPPVSPPTHPKLSSSPQDIHIRLEEMPELNQIDVDCTLNQPSIPTKSTSAPKQGSEKGSKLQNHINGNTERGRVAKQIFHPKRKKPDPLGQLFNNKT